MGARAHAIITNIILNLIIYTRVVGGLNVINKVNIVISLVAASVMLGRSFLSSATAGMLDAAGRRSKKGFAEPTASTTL